MKVDTALYENGSFSGTDYLEGFSNNASFKNQGNFSWNFWVNVLYARTMEQTGNAFMFFGNNLAGQFNDTLINFNTINQENRTIVFLEHGRGMKSPPSWEKGFETLTIGRHCSTCEMNYGKWHMITMTVNESTWAVWVDGKLTNQSLDSKPLTREISNSYSVGDIFDDGVNVTFVLGDLRIWGNHSLSKKEIKELFDETKEKWEVNK